MNSNGQPELLYNTTFTCALAFGERLTKELVPWFTTLTVVQVEQCMLLVSMRPGLTDTAGLSSSCRVLQLTHSLDTLIVAAIAHSVKLSWPYSFASLDTFKKETALYSYKWLFIFTRSKS